MSLFKRTKAVPTTSPEVERAATAKPATNPDPEYPTIVVRLTPDGLKVSLEAWRHNAPVNLLAALDVRVQHAIHQWRGKFLAEESKFGTPNARERDLSEEQRRLA